MLEEGAVAMTIALPIVGTFHCRLKLEMECTIPHTRSAGTGFSQWSAIS
jgi:hypothetical protein